MLAIWFDSSLANVAVVLAAVLAFLVLARRLLLGAATDRDQGSGRVRRPGPPPLPRAKVCPNGDCSAPNRPDANYCRRCGTKL